MINILGIESTRWCGFAIRAFILFIWHGLQIRTSVAKVFFTINFLIIQKNIISL